MNRGLDDLTIARMLHVDAAHGSAVAAAWAGVTTAVVARHRRDRGLRRRDGDQRGRPSRLELLAQPYREDCSCPRCCDVRTALMAYQPVRLTAVPDITPQLPDAEAWRAYAACADEPGTTFFPSEGRGHKFDATRARAICVTCPVQADCLDYAITNHIDHGMWGGATEKERRRIRRQRQRPEAS